MEGYQSVPDIFHLRQYRTCKLSGWTQNPSGRIHLRQLNVNIHKLNIESNDGIFEGRIQLFVHDVDDVKSITTNLRKIDEIKTVTRIEKFEDQPN